MINRPTHDPLRRRMIALAVVACALFVFLTTPCSAKEHPKSGSSSKHLRKQTVNSLPYHQLNQQTKDKIGDILQKPSIYRQLPVTAIQADPDYFRFLVRYPEVIVNIWQLMGVTKMTTQRTGPYSITTNDGAGTISSLELIYGNDNLHIFYGTGTYEGPILKRKLNGRCVLVLRTENKVDASGQPVATSKLDVFLKVDNATAGLIAKTIQPLVGTTADHNFVESLKFVQRLNETTSKNGPGVQRMGERLRIDTQVRQKLNEVVDVVFQRAINASAPAGQRTTVRPALMESSNKIPVRPPTNLNQLDPGQAQRQNGFSGSAYQQNDLGKTRPGYPMHNGVSAGYGAGQHYRTLNQPLPISQNYLPAHGNQAPAYSAGTGFPNQQHPQNYGQPVQAGYDYSRQPQGYVTPAGSWSPRR